MKYFYMYLNVSSLGSLGLANVAMKMLGLSDANSQSVTDNVALPLWSESAKLSPANYSVMVDQSI